MNQAAASDAVGQQVNAQIIDHAKDNCRYPRITKRRFAE
jgi:hypothetical protein